MQAHYKLSFFTCLDTAIPFANAKKAHRTGNHCFQRVYLKVAGTSNWYSDFSIFVGQQQVEKEIAYQIGNRNFKPSTSSCCWSRNGRHWIFITCALLFSINK